MDNSALAGAGILMVLLFLAGLVFLIVLFVAPIKLYSIHREIKRTNELLNHQLQLTIVIEERSTSTVRLLEALGNAAKDKDRITP